MLLKKCIFSKIIGLRNYSKELTVSPFCNIVFKSLNSITVRPLDAFKYGNSDKVIITSINSEHESNLQLSQENEYIIINDEDVDKGEKVTWNIEAPLKANLRLKSAEDIDILNFNGEFLELHSKNGNITISKCHADKINLFCNGGHIIAKGILQGASIILETTKNGHITTDKLQGLKLHIKTENGDIKTNSSYCDHAIIETQCGNLLLQNVHRNNKIHIYDTGNLKLTGFDGTLNATINNGTADVQISRIENNSKLVVQRGDVFLKLADTVQNNSSVSIESNGIDVSEELNMTSQLVDNKVILSSENVNTDLKVKCVNSFVKVTSLSWAEMFKMSLNKQN